MINLSNKFNGFSSTMKNISKIKNDEYMTNSQYEVYNFDKIKEDFCKRNYKDENLLTSNDGILLHTNDNLYFIEFKSGVLNDKEKSNIKRKIFDSIFILLHYIDEKININDLRKYLNYILVYDEDKNGYNKIRQNVDKDARNGNQWFSKIKILENLYFKEVKLMTIDDFNKSEFYK